MLASPGPLASVRVALKAGLAPRLVAPLRLEGELRLEAEAGAVGDLEGG